MTARKRKQPERKRKPVRRGPHPADGGAAPCRPDCRAPTARAFGGSAAFAIVFSFVAANAMWYQPGAHPSPFLRTRLPFRPEPRRRARKRTDFNPAR